METRPKSIFVDIDGTIFHYNHDVVVGNTDIADVIVGTEERIDEWWNKGYKIILTTGRGEHQRTDTVNQLFRAGIRYHHLIMGIGGGIRVLINDAKPDGTATALAYSLERNSGLEQLKDL